MFSEAQLRCFSSESLMKLQSDGSYAWGHLECFFNHVWYPDWEDLESWGLKWWSSSSISFYFYGVPPVVSRACRLDCNQTSYIKLRTPKVHLLWDQELGRSCITFSNLVLQVTILLPTWVIHRPAQVPGREHKSHYLMEEYQRHIFKENIWKI